MKSKHIKQWLSILMAAALTLGSPAIPTDTAAAEPAKAAATVTLTESNDREVNFNKDWKFLLDETEELEAGGKDYDDSSWENIQIFKFPMTSVSHRILIQNMNLNPDFYREARDGIVKKPYFLPATMGNPLF